MDPENARLLAELVADVRASVDDALGRGGRYDRGGDLPPAASPAPSAESGPTAAASGWSNLAREARETPNGAAARLALVRDDLGDCRRCGLCTRRRTIVFGVGDPAADLVVVGEAPDYNEDQQGEPFVGPAGQMLDKMLQHVLGLEREQVYILNVVKCRPPDKRDPLPEEVEACRPFFEGQLQAIAPKLMLVLGEVAFQAMFRSDEGLARVRGQWRDYGGVPTMPTFHPAYLQQTPDDKRLTFADLKELRARYDAVGGRR
jgi:uracil-DNA glycosylase